MLQLIATPPFIIDCRQFNNEERPVPLPLIDKMKMYSQIFIDVIISLGKAIKQNSLSAARLLTKFILHIFAKNLPLCMHVVYATIALVVWAAIAIFQLYTTTTYFYYQKHTRNPLADVEKFTDPELNLQHLKTLHERIDTRQIPVEITVDKLLTIFDKINFNHPDQPGYINPNSLTDDGKSITVATLRAGLEDHLLRNIREKKALIGTPPAESPLLDVFYSQLTDFIRYSLWVVLIQKDPQKAENLKEQDEHLIMQARLAIDLARAGLHCGSRYMSEAVQAYTFLKANESSIHPLSLRARYYSFLANKRLKIVQKRIDKLGTDAHLYSTYMANLAGPLALPGLGNIVEHIGHQSIHQETELRLFFEKYHAFYLKRKTAKIIERNQEFRELVYEWMQDQMGEWNLDFYQHLRQLFKNEFTLLWHTLQASQDMSEKIACVPEEISTSRLKAVNLLIHTLEHLNQHANNELVAKLAEEQEEEIKKKILISFLFEQARIFPFEAQGRLAKMQAAQLLLNLVTPLLETLQEKDQGKKLRALQTMRAVALRMDQASMLLKLCQKEEYQLPANLQEMSNRLARDRPQEALNEYFDYLIEAKRKHQFLELLHEKHKLKASAIEWFMLAHQVLHPE